MMICPFSVLHFQRLLGNVITVLSPRLL